MNKDTVLSLKRMTTRTGTDGFRAPEMDEGKDYLGPQVDVFSLGCVLFILVAGAPVCNGCNHSDPIYSCLCNHKPHQFWKKNREVFGHFYPKDLKFSHAFMDLIENMICFDPAYRLNLIAVRNHPWLEQEEATDDEVMEEMEKRRGLAKTVSGKQIKTDLELLKNLSYNVDLQKAMSKHLNKAISDKKESSPNSSRE